MEKEIYVVTVGYDYEGSRVIGVFDTEEEAMACMREEIEEEWGDYVLVNAWRGRERRLVAEHYYDDDDDDDYDYD
jgi:hypothetical protein